jgi:hypothetical protein
MTLNISDVIEAILRHFSYLKLTKVSPHKVKSLIIFKSLSPTLFCVYIMHASLSLSRHTLSQPRSFSYRERE